MMKSLMTPDEVIEVLKATNKSLKSAQNLLDQALAERREARLTAMALAFVVAKPNSEIRVLDVAVKAVREQGLCEVPYWPEAS
jgi:hypothetical protein